MLNEDKALSQIISYVAECTRATKSSTIILFSPQLPSLALMERFVWLMDQLRMLAEWRSASMECGEECVELIGLASIEIIPELCADSWGTMLMQEKVS